MRKFPCYPRQLQRSDMGCIFGEGLCLPTHAALTSAGAQGFSMGEGEEGVRGWR